MRECLTQKIIYSLCSHSTPTGKIVEDLDFKVHKVNFYMRGRRRRKELRSEQLTKADLKAEVPK